MFAEIVAASGKWPKTRTEVYEQVCRYLVKEANPWHRNNNTDRPPDLNLQEVAGAVFAQMILGGKHSINLDGNVQNDVVSIQDLSNIGVDMRAIRSALSTKLFRGGPEPGTLIPCHRTIAEFLGAKWIVQQSKAGLSLRRLGTLFYGKHQLVPSALRGLHAWCASLHANTTVSKTFIQGDPYGLLLYGDSELLSVDSARHLLSALIELGKRNPRFREGESSRLAGKGLIQLGLKTEIVRTLTTPTSGFETRRPLLSIVSFPTPNDQVHCRH
jgi:hypothetical protein